MLIVGLWSIAMAYDGECTAPEVQGSVPTANGMVAQGQPIVILTNNDTCHDELTFRLYGANEQAAIVTLERESRGNTLLYRSAPVELPTGAYALELSNGWTSWLEFSVGEAPYQSPPLELVAFDSTLLDVQDVGVLQITMEAMVQALPGIIVHWSGDPEPVGPWFATVADGTAHTVQMSLSSTDGEACVHVRLESPTGELSPWSRRCHIVEPPEEEPPEEEPPEETGTPRDTGFVIPHTGYWLEDGYYYDDDPGFVMFACGGCRSTPGPMGAAWLLPLLVAVRRRR